MDDTRMNTREVMDRVVAGDTRELVRRDVRIVNSQGLHARPVMRFVDLANQFQAKILVQRDDQSVDGKSPMEMMLLEATQGTTLTLIAQGDDAESAVEALAALVESGFDEL
jgi:phosphocarrier protein HPr